VRIILSFFFILLAFLSKTSIHALKGKENKESNHSKIKQDQRMKEKTILLSKAEILKKLKELKNKPIPTELSTGAMCYKVAMPPDRIDYICPVCGEKTLYLKNPAFPILKELPSMRSLVKPLEKYGIVLDERALCKKCQTQTSEKTVCLIIPYLENVNQPHKKCPIRDHELKLLNDFFNGKDKYANEYDVETPLVNYLQNLYKIFGLKNE